MKIRKFSVPYDTTIRPSDYLGALAPYRENIDHIYFGFPMLGNNYHNRYAHNPDYSYETVLQEQKNVEKLLKLSKDKYKRVIALNNIHINTMNMDKRVFAQQYIIPILKEYSVEGIIITDFAIAKYIHEELPELEICTSCNGHIWTKKQMDIWAEEAGATLFNPPREVLRMPEMLKYFRSTGYRLKYLLNECCTFGCPYCIEHALNVAYKEDNNTRVCSRGDAANFLRSTFVLPRWLPQLDEYIDVYKISGRMSCLGFIVETLDAYLNERDDVDMRKITLGGVYKNELKETPVYAKDIPDKLLTCECKDCNKTCFLCDKVIKDCIAKSAKNKISEVIK